MDNAAARANFASKIYESGVKAEKASVLAALPARLSELHTSGSIHIHDLEAFGKVYNCSTPDLAQYLENADILSVTDAGKIYELVESVEQLITELALEQSGGIGFGNFDIDMSATFERFGVSCNEDNVAALGDAIRSFVKWVNVTHTRFCREPYYVTLNVGLGTSQWARAVCAALLAACEASPSTYTRPNIVFKVSETVNFLPDSANRDLFLKAVACTAKRMIPTYLLMDSPANRECNPLRLNIMGCRTRVYANALGAEGTIGRGNVGCVSINVPRIALQSHSMEEFETLLRSLMDDCFEILDLRRTRLLESRGENLRFVLGKGIWNGASSVEEIAEQGTYSVGFIGIAETVEILEELEDCDQNDSDDLGYHIVSLMADVVADRRKRFIRNYSLLASPGEMISGRFCELDTARFPHHVQEKGFYTNSFHVPVDKGTPLLGKIAQEAPFHAICNGGAISYVEFGSAPLDNVDALEDAIAFAAHAGVSYLGFNYPMDTCRTCGYVGTFDTCERCGSDDILRIRRVSGYLEDLSFFTSGKSAEAKIRTANG